MSLSQGKAALTHARVWHLVDAKGKGLGRIAQRISIALRGKYKPFYDPAVDSGDYVVVVNARHIELAGNKRETKTYFWHSGHPGGVTTKSYKDFSADHPNGPLKKAIYGMLPKNRLRPHQFKRLFVFADDDHPYDANIFRDYEKEAFEKALSEFQNSTPKSEQSSS
ncbi:ribosomal protein L13 domain-containing protein [Polychytrium aggregatum]|uniref:ribosomal protein L13 domain-containing protein n=1 Tax=Polychytrium aggregatum TaxID=110093 RepID=UPI0022FE5DBC|nr:ribosomal protein L13 domain-containing protein [Polychytrium aggregatum]KAI9206213.1 ribosomal protein L13 domain-containing protein [Polychytrium aggregatum]